MSKKFMYVMTIAWLAGAIYRGVLQQEYIAGLLAACIAIAHGVVAMYLQKEET